MLSKWKRSALGANVPHDKATANMATVTMPLPEKIILPMQQHIGAPCTPAVKKGDTVYVGTVVGTAGGFVGATIHSGVSGTVEAIDSVLASNGRKVPAVVIRPDGSQTPDPACVPPQVTDHKSLIAAVQACGLVGLGGAGFPTAVKLSPKNLEEIDTLVINGAECEPYITSDNREFLECSESVLRGIAAVKKHLGIKKVVIGIERNKPEAIDLMFSLVKNDPDYTVLPLASRYPQGAEKMLIEKATKREVPRGGLPSDVGVIVMNVTTVSTLGKYLSTGMPLTKKRLTVDGDAIGSPKNVEVIIGTPIANVLDFCGIKDNVSKILMGGPMMGTAVADPASPVLKQNNALVAFGPQLASLPEPGACIRCGSCINACPMGLSPVEIAGAFNRNDADALNALMVDLCIGCGTCSFVCPAKRPVTQTMNLAKGVMMKAKNGGKK
ncbi:MAG: electron transport complex subunit RsxC [Subdoligranulum sp.]|nr:electron transport complex subunit RsxC [Subdoligranulum sp.]